MEQRAARPREEERVAMPAHHEVKAWRTKGEAGRGSVQGGEEERGRW